MPARIPMAEPAPNNALQLTAYSLRFATLRFGFRQQLKAGVRRSTSEWRGGDVLWSDSCPQHVLMFRYTGSATHF